MGCHLDPERARRSAQAGLSSGWSGGQLGALGCLGAARRTSELDVFLAVRDLDRSNAHGLFASWANPYGRGRRGVELAWLGHGASSCWYRRIAPWSQGTRGLYFCTSTEPFGEIRNPDGAISRLALSHREAGPRPQHVRFARTQRELALLEGRARKVRDRQSERHHADAQGRANENPRASVAGFEFSGGVF